MRHIVIALGIALLLAGCAKENPLSPTMDIIHSGNLQATFSIPRESYGIHDTLTATTQVYNSGQDTATFIVPVCWPIAWYKVWNSKGTAVLSYIEPRTYGCYSIIDYSILPHQTRNVSLLSVAIPIARLDSTQSSHGNYVLKV